TSGSWRSGVPRRRRSSTSVVGRVLVAGLVRVRIGPGVGGVVVRLAVVLDLGGVVLLAVAVALGGVVLLAVAVTLGGVVLLTVAVGLVDRGLSAAAVRVGLRADHAADAQGADDRGGSDDSRMATPGVSAE